MANCIVLALHSYYQSHSWNQHFILENKNCHMTSDSDSDVENKHRELDITKDTGVKHWPSLSRLFIVFEKTGLHWPL